MTTTELVPTRVITSAGAPVPAAGLARPRLVSPVSAALAAATPAVTLPMLALSRYWSGHGALHSIGDMVPLALGGAVSLAGAMWTQDEPMLAGTCVAVAGSLLAVGTMAYPAGLAEPLITTMMATVFGWMLTRRVVRKTKEAEREYADRQAERDNAVNLAVVNGQTQLGVATIAGETRIRVAQIRGQADLGVADRHVLAAIGERHGFTVEQLGQAQAHRQALDAAPAPKALEAAAAPMDDLFDVAATLGLEQRL
jgi:hypothetical protein